MRHRPALVAAAMMALAPIWSALSADASPPNGGTISIEARTAGPDDTDAMRSLVSAAGEAFAGKGFTVLQDAGHAAYVAELTWSRTEVGTGSAKVPAGKGAITPGGAFGSVGAGVAIPLPTGRSALVPLQRTRLDISIHRRAEPATIWHGSAVTVRPGGTGAGADEKVALDLSQAVVGSYPAEPDDVVGVP